MRAPEFEASLHDAALYPQLWRLLLGAGLALLMWVSVSVLIVGAAVAVVAGREGAFGIMPFVNGLASPDTPGKVVLLLATFAGLMLGAVVAAAALHFRGPGSLLGPWSEWRRGFLTALAVLVPIYGVLMGISILFGEPVRNLELARWAALLPLALPFLFLQIAAEELFFRGYLQQQLAVRFRARWVWFWIPAVIFAVLHTNPTAGPNLPLVLLAALTFGLVAADLTERTGSLGAAMGVHLGNNFFGIFVLATADTITGLSLYVSQVDLGETGAQSLSMAGATILLLIVWGILVKLLDR
jgi:hypothetical protein